MSRLWDVAKHEFHEVLPPTIFFLVAFHIVILDRILLLRQYYCATRELIRTIGRKQVQIMFFGAPGTSPARTH